MSDSKIQDEVNKYIADKFKNSGLLGSSFNAGDEESVKERIKASVVSSLKNFIPFTPSVSVVSDPNDPNSFIINTTIQPQYLINSYDFSYTTMEKLSDENDSTHSWVPRYETSRGDRYSKCKTCGLNKEKFDGEISATYNLSCEEMAIKDIIE